MSTKKSKNYVDNKKLYDCIVQYKKECKTAKLSGKEKPPIPEYAGKAILLIAKGLAERYYKFARYSYNDEMVGDAILNCIKYFDNFDEHVFNNPHAYFTMICYRTNQQRIKIEKKSQYVKFKSFENDMILHGDPDIIFHDRHGLIEKEMYDNISSYIEDFEKKEEVRKQERKAKNDIRKMKDSLDRFIEEED